MKSRKKKNRKAFTIVELLAVIVILTVIGGIAVGAYYQYYEKAKVRVFENYEQSMKDAAVEYVIDTGEMPTSSTPIRLDLRYLAGETVNGKKVKKPYIEYLDNPNSKGDRCLNGSYVEVRLGTKKTTTDGKVDNNKKFEYKVCLVCEGYKTSGC
jgi:prepilin-type N-terminal cleavage/methylation domain-containing protein